MSATVLYVVQQNGDAIPEAEFRNSWGGAAFIWAALATRYKDQIVALGEPDDFYDLRGGKELKFDREWPLVWHYEQADNCAMTQWEHNACRATYDKALIAPESFPMLADSFERFQDAHRKPSRVCSLGDQASIIRRLTNARGVGWNWTTVGDSFWDIWSEEREEGRPYNIDRDEGHEFVELVEL